MPGRRESRVLTSASLFYDLVPPLVRAFARFLDGGPKQDPSCLAKKAIARSLVELDCDDVEFFRAGLRCRQPEPTYGGSVDTAADVRASCAMGLVASGYPRALIELAELLADSEAQARLGAVRAIACGTPREAARLHRSETAFDWLLAIVASADRRLAEEALATLAAHKRNATSTERVRAAVEDLRDGRIAERFESLWCRKEESEKGS